MILLLYTANYSVPLSKMSDHRIEDLSVSIVKAVQLAQQLSRTAHSGGNGKDTQVNFQRLADSLALTSDALNFLKLNIERYKTMLSSAGLSLTKGILAEFDAVFRRVEEAVENARDDDGTVENKGLQESEADALLPQLNEVESKVLLISHVIFYAALIQRGETESVRQRQEGEIWALLDGQRRTNEEPDASTSKNTAAVPHDATGGQASDFRSTAEMDQPSQCPGKKGGEGIMNQVTRTFHSFGFKGQNNEIAQDTSSPGPPTNPSDCTRRVTETRKETSPIIVGIDFGATSSAVAFALENSNRQEPKVLDRWPESVRWSIDGVPREQQIQSTVYYGPGLKVIGWGDDKYEAVGPCREHVGVVAVCWPRPGVQQYRDFKLGLAPPRDNNLYVPLPLGKSTADVAADYLWHLRQSACSQIEDQLSAESGKAQGSLRYVMTVPAFWDEEAQGRLYKVAKMAGFWIKSDKELALVPGPEAAMLYADSIDSSAFEVGDNILVADCGGNFVESVTYEVKSRDPLRVERCAAVSVASCGSAEVTRRFMSIVESKIKKLGLSDLTMAKSRLRARCRLQFERHIKLEFGRHDFQPPPGIPRGVWAAYVGGDAEFPEADLEEGYMMFSNEEIYSCFDPVVDRTIELIENQIAAVRAQNKGLQVR